MPTKIRDLSIEQKNKICSRANRNDCKDDTCLLVHEGHCHLRGRIPEEFGNKEIEVPE